MTRVRVAAVGDIHCKRTSRGELEPLFAEVSAAADVLLLCGDLTDYGLAEEAQVLAGEARAALRIPALAVLGNHDHESSTSSSARGTPSRRSMRPGSSTPRTARSWACPSSSFRPRR